MQFKNYLSSQQKFINKSLLKYLPAPPKKNIPETQLILACHYAVNSGGKRLRPIMCLESAKIFNNNINKVLPVACALELIHIYSLIHDDLPCMDNDDFRRGQPTVHKKFSESTALLAGTALSTLAFEIISNCALKEKNKNLQKKYLEIIKDISCRLGLTGLIQGQVLDLHYNKKTTPEKLKEINYLKTSQLFIIAVTCGAKLQNATPKQIKTLENFGKYFGLFFQKYDDLNENQGMLFISPVKMKPGFWMKNMKFAIDIIWLNENKIVDLTANLLPPIGDDLRVYYPKEPVNKVLEVKAGFINRNNLKIGEEIIIK